MKRFGLLCNPTAGNIGDDIQNLATRQFLPSLDAYVPRESLHDVREDLHMILNGWFCHFPERWPPSPRVTPLLVSMHISPLPSAPTRTITADQVFTQPPVADYLRQHGPVGARDQETEALLKGAGIESYFSGCMTLTIPRPPVPRADDLVVINEVPALALARLRKTTGKRLFRTWHGNFADRDPAERQVRAQELLDLYARASCVVTSRLHCALPCLAIGTPVLLVDVAPDQGRFTGLRDFLHHRPWQAVANGTAGYDIDNPPPNKELHLPYRAGLIEAARRFVA